MKILEMMEMKKLLMALALMPLMALADIDNILVSRLEPWEGKVKIEYRIAGKIDASDGMVLQAMALKDHKSGRSYPVLSVDRRPTFEEGVHSLIWDAWADGCDIESSEVSVSIAIKKGSPEYCVINLSGGQDAEEYPVSFLDEIPDGGWTSLYKTDNIVLHLVRPGSFAMGRKTSKDRKTGDYKNYRPKVTLTQPFYLGVFETTQRQWELVMGDRPSRFSYTPCYATRPVENVSAKEILSDKDSFMERLSRRTGIECGVPTEAQWEYACRAGTTTDFYNGENLSYFFNIAGVVQHALDRIGRYGYNGGWFVSPENSSVFWPRLTTAHGTASVGSYEPNGWGFYDMSGNVAELCRDLFSDFVGSDGDEVVDPMTTVGRGNVMKGGGCFSAGASCRSSSREEAKYDLGFRIFCPAAIGDVETICIVQSAKVACDFRHPYVPDVRYSGKHGGLSWQYENGKLWVSGSGAMPRSPHPWSFLCSLASELQIDHGVTNVADGAFAHFRNLTRLTIPNSVKNVDDTAFVDCNRIEDVTLSLSGQSAVVQLPWGAEKFDAVLRKVFLDQSVFEIRFYDQFVGRQIWGLNFVEYEVDPQNAVYCSENGLLLDKTKKKLCGVPFGMQYVDIPLGVVSVESAAFDSSQVTAIHIPESVTLLADESLWHATPVSLKIPRSVQIIGAAAMGGVASSSLRNLVIGDGTETIGGKAFWEHWAMNIISIGKSVHYIGTDAFDDCAPKNLYFYGAVPYGLVESGLLDEAQNVYYPKAYASSYAAVVDDEQFAGFSDGVVPRIRHDIIFDAMGGECGRSQMMVLDGEKILKLPRAVRKGYRFLGWYTAHDGRGIRMTEPVSVYGSMCLYAAWAPDPSVPDSAILTHRVAFDDVHTGDSWRNFFWHVPHGEAIGEMPDPDQEGYVDEGLKFDGWYTKRVGGTRIEKTTEITSDLVLFAHWTYERVGDVGTTWSNPRTLEVGASAKSESATLVPSDSGRGILYYKFKLRCGESIRLDVRDDFRYDFETYSEFYGSSGYADLNVHEEWVDDKGMILATLEYGEGDEVGELIDCYLVVRGDVGERISFAYSKGHREELLVGFEPCLGKCAEDEREIPYGSVVGGLPVPQRPGFSFLGWYTDQIGGTKVSSSFRPECDLFLFAHWQPDGSIDSDKCAVLFDPKGGECEEKMRTVEIGKAIGTLPTPVRSKYKFLGWYTAEKGGTKISSTTKVTADVIYYAHWQYDGLALISAKVVADCAGMGSASGGKRAKAGTKVTLKATAKKGYAFAGWYLGGELMSKAASYSFKTTDEDVDYRARFVTLAEDKASIGATVNGMQFSSTSGQETASPLATNTMCGVALFWPLSHEALSATSVKVTGLPKGLKYDTKKKAITGVPTVPGKTSSVKIAVTTAGKQTVTFVLKVAVVALPEWARGQFTGNVDENVLTMSVGSTGKVSGKFKQGATNWTFSASSFSAASQTAAEPLALVCSATAKGTYKAKSGKKTVTKSVTAPISFTLVAAPDLSPIAAEGLGDFAGGTGNVEIRRVAGVRLSVDGVKGETVKMDKSYGQVASGKSVKLTVKLTKGYAFLGWFDAQTGARLSQATAYSLKMSGADRIVVARFAKESALAVPVLSWNAATNLTVGVSYSATPKVSGEAAVKIVSVSGLPAGLAYKSGKVSGAPTAVKAYTVSAKVALATNSKKTWTLKQKLVVVALPAWAKGTYVGGWSEGEGTGTNQVTLPVGSTGKVSGKLNFATASWTLTGTKYTKLDPEERTATLSLTAKKGTAKKTVAVTVGADELGGFAYSETKGCCFEARQNLWKKDEAWIVVAESLVGAPEYYDPAGDLMVAFGANGTATAKLTVGRNTFTCTSVLCPIGIDETAVTGKLYLYFAPNTKKKFKGAVRVVEFQSW